MTWKCLVCSLNGQYSYLTRIFSTGFSPCWIRTLSSEHRKVQRNLDCHPWWALLAANRKMHRFQNCSSGVTLHGRRCTGVFDGTVPSRQFSCRSTKPPGSASRGDLVIPRFRLRTFGYQAFAVSGPQLWNSLPLDVRQSHDNLLGAVHKVCHAIFDDFWPPLPPVTNCHKSWTPPSP